ncbi:hypothetical protein DPEC_G00230340 [Dallia pectoralis]|uniref:Uncharacterized protein n=1 Tax=Dallia pectoralis TaxID=75939 RepID=A0ACC2G1W7_DALPE|nr:hypothetical protein DPEC_G00230340 [Dallia pectoralis]
MNKTWTEAQSYCREIYTDLATVSDYQDYNRLNTLLYNTQGYSGDAWMGLKYNRWMWSLVGNETEGITNWWSAGNPWYQYYLYGIGLKTCVMTSGGMWSGTDCDSQYYFVCYDGRQNATQTLVLVTEYMTWYQAQSYCRENYTDLAIVRNQTENQAIQNLTQYFYTNLVNVGNQTVNQTEIYYNQVWIEQCSYSLNTSHQYHLVNMNKNWTEAQSYCRETYTDLASITDPDEYYSVICQINSTRGSSGQAWIGLKYNWRWSLKNNETEGISSGWPGGYPWVQNVYMPGNGQFCVMMTTYYGQWQENDCDISFYFVCYDGRQNATQAFVLVQEYKTWNQAQSYCRENYTDLAIVRNQTENQALWNLTQSFRTNLVYVGNQTVNQTQIYYIPVWIVLHRNLQQYFTFCLLYSDKQYHNSAPNSTCYNPAPNKTCYNPAPNNTHLYKQWIYFMMKSSDKAFQRSSH